MVANIGHYFLHCLRFLFHLKLGLVVASENSELILQDQGLWILPGIVWYYKRLKKCSVMIRAILCKNYPQSELRTLIMGSHSNRDQKSVPSVAIWGQPPHRACDKSFVFMYMEINRYWFNTELVPFSCPVLIRWWMKIYISESENAINFILHINAWIICL